MPSLEEFIKQVRSGPKTPFLVEGLIPANPGYTIIAGKTGLGKTNLVSQLLLSISSGEDFLGFRTNSCYTSYLGFEGGTEEMCDRVEKIQRQYTNGTLAKVSYNIIEPRKLEGNEEWFMHEAECDTKKIGALAFDPLVFLVKGRYTKPEDAMRFIEQLRSFQSRVNAHIVLAHHVRKRGNDPRYVLEPGDLDEIKGAGDYCNHADCVMLLERERQQRIPGTRGFMPARLGYYTLHFCKARFSSHGLPPPLSLVFNEDTVMFEIDKEPRI